MGMSRSCEAIGPPKGKLHVRVAQGSQRIWGFRQTSCIIALSFCNGGCLFLCEVPDLRDYEGNDDGLS